MGLLKLRSALLSSGLSKESLTINLRAYLESHVISPCTSKLNRLLESLTADSAELVLETAPASSSMVSSSIEPPIPDVTFSTATAHIGFSSGGQPGSSIASSNASSKLEKQKCGNYTRYQTPLDDFMSKSESLPLFSSFRFRWLTSRMLFCLHG